MDWTPEKKSISAFEKDFRRLSTNNQELNQLPLDDENTNRPAPAQYPTKKLPGAKLPEIRRAFLELSTNRVAQPIVTTKDPIKPHVSLYDSSTVRHSDGPKETIEVLDEKRQQAYLDQMFEEQAREKLHKLPSVNLPLHLLLSKLQPHQQGGIRWLVSRETSINTNPFFKRLKLSSGIECYRCSLTGRRKYEPPKPIRGAILADAMGIGKTFQALGLILSNPPKGLVYPVASEQRNVVSRVTTLLVAPVSVMGGWLEQMEAHLKPGTLQVVMYTGSKRKTFLPGIWCGRYDIVVVSYDTLRAEYFSIVSSQKGHKPVPATLFEARYFRVILDEAHMIRNHTTAVFKAVNHIDTTHKICLTGTPFFNTLNDIYALLSFVGVEPLNDEDVFQRAVVDMVRRGRPCGLARIRVAMGHVSLRRTKNNVNIHIPLRTEIIKKVPFHEGEHKLIHDTLYHTAKAAFGTLLSQSEVLGGATQHMFVIVLRVRQACCSATLLTDRHRSNLKVFARRIESLDLNAITPAQALKLLEVLCACIQDPKATIGTKETSAISSGTPLSVEVGKDVSAKKTGKDTRSFQNVAPSPKIQALIHYITSMGSDEKGVVFSSFTTFLDEIQFHFRKAGHTFTRIDGSVDAEGRFKAIRDFQQETGGPRFILCSLKATNAGINLTRGSWVFLTDQWFNDSIMRQAADRCHRQGQKRPVKVIHLIMEDSIEQRMLSVQKTKATLARGSMEKLSAADEGHAKITALADLFSIDKSDSGMDTTMNESDNSISV